MIFQVLHQLSAKFYLLFHLLYPASILTNTLKVYIYIYIYIYITKKSYYLLERIIKLHRLQKTDCSCYLQNIYSRIYTIKCSLTQSIPHHLILLLLFVLL